MRNSNSWFSAKELMPPRNTHILIYVNDGTNDRIYSAWSDYGEENTFLGCFTISLHGNFEKNIDFLNGFDITHWCYYPDLE